MFNSICGFIIGLFVGVIASILLSVYLYIKDEKSKDEKENNE